MVALVVLDHDGRLLRTQAVQPEIRGKVVETLEIRVHGRALTVDDEHDAVHIAQDVSPGSIVHDLARNGTQVQSNGVTLECSELYGKHFEKGSALCFGAQSQKAAAVLRLRFSMNALQVGRLTRMPGAVVDELQKQLFVGVVDGGHVRTRAKSFPRSAVSDPNARRG